jgi:hypothetical protein
MRRFILSLVALAALGAVLKNAFPDVARYLKIRKM